jgi:hypothetical protein
MSGATDAQLFAQSVSTAAQFPHDSGSKATNAFFGAQAANAVQPASAAVAGPQYLAPTATRSTAHPVTTAVAKGLENLPTVDASYSLLNDNTKVVQAQGVGVLATWVVTSPGT